jgi:hypothetical protein
VKGFGARNVVFRRDGSEGKTPPGYWRVNEDVRSASRFFFGASIFGGGLHCVGRGESRKAAVVKAVVVVVVVAWWRLLLSMPLPRELEMDVTHGRLAICQQ